MIKNNNEFSFFFFFRVIIIQNLIVAFFFCLSFKLYSADPNMNEMHYSLFNIEPNEYYDK